MAPHTRPPLERFWEKVDASGGGDACWPWLAARDVDGYGFFFIARGLSSVRATRFMWELFNGAIAEGLLACHSCDNPPCVNPAHLFLGTPTDNARDRESKHRHPHIGPLSPRRGERHPFAKLTDDDVRYIRSAVSEGVRPIRLAERFGVGKNAISDIVHRKKWQSVV